jgi:aspartate/methionine/tyrosine aminotransferase
MKINDFKLEEFFAKYEFKAKYLLCASDCESYTIDELLALQKGSKEELKNQSLGYTESQGNSILRSEISNLYNDLTKDEIIVFSGAEEGIFIFMNVFLDQGDHIIVQFPAYQSLFEVAASVGCEITQWIMDENQNWELNIEELRSLIKKNTKLIIINFPHNPTGYLISREKFEKLIELAEQNNIYIFSDEVYRFLEYSENDRLPNMCDCYENGISLGVMSKAFGLAGLRIGWIATRNKKLLKRMLSFKNYTTICSSAPSEFFATLALISKEKIIERNLSIIKNNLKLIENFFHQQKALFSWKKPKAGCIAFPRIDFDKSSEEFCIKLYQDTGVLLLPSSMYDYDDKHFRIGFGRRDLVDGLRILEDYIQKIKK